MLSNEENEIEVKHTNGYSGILYGKTEILGISVGEEKKAYEEAKLYLEHTGIDDFNLEKHQCENRKWAIDVVLNLIEKQQKEIGELKMKLEVEKIDNKYNKEEAYEEMIPRYKIKSKIEDKESQINDIKDNLDYNEVMIKEVKRLEDEIEVLQSLLEEE